MLNELERPTLNISLDLDIPKMEPLKHDLDKVEVFAKKLDEFYRDAIEKSDDLDIGLVKQERTKVRRVIKTIEDNRKAMVKAYKHVRDCILEWKEINPEIKSLVEKIPHRPYWDGFLFNKLADYPEWEVEWRQESNVILNETKWSEESINIKKDSSLCSEWQYSYKYKFSKSWANIL